MTLPWLESPSEAFKADGCAAAQLTRQAAHGEIRNMEKTQADAIAQAILEPGLRAQEELRSKRAAESAQLARKRRVAWFTLCGAGIGVAVAHFSGAHFSVCVMWGGLAGSAVGWLITRQAAG